MKIQHWTSTMEKQVEARVNIVMRDPMLLSVLNKFGGRVFRRSSVFHGLGEFLADQKISGDVCFEIGSWAGLTSAVLSRHFRKVVSIDIVDNPIKREIHEHLGITNVEFIQISHNDDKHKLCKGLHFDFAYMDGNHAEDTELDWELVSRCGRVLFHEYWPFQSPVWELVNSLPESEVVTGGYGLALWDKSRGRR